MNSLNEKILVIAAHPDDEILGCGGTVALYRKMGIPVTSVIFCEGESLRYANQNINMTLCSQNAAKKLGVTDIRNLNFPDQRLDQFNLIEIVRPLEEIIKEIRPTIIYCQYGGDINYDHEILFKATLVAVRPVEKYIKSVFTFDTASSTEWAYPRTFIPDTWVDITSTLEIKLQAIACYISEIRDYPHPRSLEALKNRAYSWGNQMCLPAAEAFMTVRFVYRNGSVPL
ncbi:PIG-L deacetylase family protein [Xenorhabdus miraniensis]|uniref:Putative N-acetyl-alpha-D-glucosaminyl L-malate deacetylase 2 n=1 Tax=Xenorhabdus miraniensis TaxID=351674 RepID=A0A2D0JPH5_9GAMM|nr:PIG-L deacetylase family protein [Xenorhabdus miraniensis]PHM48214.1 putative N-acetyl-alpha-D-glucosaminyl L-malate deacetylase 2 [Xenorhabdus miraniensis]